MPIEVRKKERESPQGLIRRFQRKIQQSGLLRRARKAMFRNREKSRNMERESALRREEIKKKYQKMRKMGRF